MSTFPSFGQSAKCPVPPYVGWVAQKCVVSYEFFALPAQEEFDPDKFWVIPDYLQRFDDGPHVYRGRYSKIEASNATAPFMRLPRFYRIKNKYPHYNPYYPPPAHLQKKEYDSTAQHMKQSAGDYRDPQGGPRFTRISYKESAERRIHNSHRILVQPNPHKVQQDISQAIQRTDKLTLFFTPWAVTSKINEMTMEENNITYVSTCFDMTY